MELGDRWSVCGDHLRFDNALSDLGRTGFSTHSISRRDSDGVLIAEAEFPFVCVDRDGNPKPGPHEVAQFFGTRPSVRPSTVRHLLVRGVATGLDIQGDGPAILFVHGFPLDRTMWRHLMATLTGWRCVAPDLRGMGQSDVPVDRCSIADYADDVAALLDVLEIEQAVVCGLSMGGYISFDLVLRHRERVRALILMNTRASADTEAGKRRRDEMAAQVQREGLGPLIESMIPKLLAPSSAQAMPHVVAHVRSMIEGNPPEGIIGALTALRNRADASSTLASIDLPTLVIAGQEDPLIPLEESRQMANAIPGAQLTVIPEAGHLTPIEQPIATGRVVAEFIEALS